MENTSFISALRLAMQLLRDGGSFGELRNRAIVVFTDGEPDEPRRGLTLQQYFAELSEFIQREVKPNHVVPFIIGIDLDLAYMARQVLRTDQYDSSAVAQRALQRLGKTLRELRIDEAPKLIDALIEAAREAIGALDEGMLQNTRNTATEEQKREFAMKLHQHLDEVKERLSKESAGADPTNMPAYQREEDRVRQFMQEHGLRVVSAESK